MNVKFSEMDSKKRVDSNMSPYDNHIQVESSLYKYQNQYIKIKLTWMLVN